MKFYIYAENSGGRTLEEVDEPTFQKARVRSPFASVLKVSELEADESSEKLKFVFITPDDLTLQGKATLLAEFAQYFHLLRPGGKIWI